MRLDRDDRSTRTTAPTPRVGARAPRRLAVIVGVAGALTLSACGQWETVTADEPCGSAAMSCVQMPSSPTAEPTGPAIDGSTGTAPEEDQDTNDGHTTNDDQDTNNAQGDVRTESLAGDDSIEIDDEGYGVVPAATLEADIKDLFVNKYGIAVTDVDCANDMKILAGGGSQSCDVITNDRTYFGLVKFLGRDGDMVKYQLSFPGLADDALDL